MAHFRFTIRQLLIATVLVAFACATVLHPSRTLFLIWTGLSWTGFVALIVTAIATRGYYRRASIGAIVFCGLHVAMLSFEAFSGEQHRAARWEVMGFRLDGCSELWNVPERTILKRVPGALAFDSTDPAVVIDRDADLLGILRWQWIWVMAGIGWVFGGFANKPVDNGKTEVLSGRFHWLYLVAISAAWVVGWQLLYYELKSLRLSGAYPRQMWSTFIPSVVLWSWLTLTLLALVGSESTRHRFSVVAVATGLWLAMAFLPGWSATLGDFLPQTMYARIPKGRTLPTPYYLHDDVQYFAPMSPAIVQGEIFPSVTAQPPSGSGERIFDLPPRLGIAAYLVGGVVGGVDYRMLENVNVSIAACMMAWPIALASRWLAKRVARVAGAEKPTSAGSLVWQAVPLCILLVLSILSRQAWVVQLSLLAVYGAIVVFAAYALVGPPPIRREYQVATLAMLGWLLVSCGPWFGDYVRPYLPTTLAFKWIDKQLGCEPGQPGPDMALSTETEKTLRSSGTWGNRAANAWPTVVASLGLDHRYPLSTPGTILMAFPTAWIGIYLSRRWPSSAANAEAPRAS